MINFFSTDENQLFFLFSSPEQWIKAMVLKHNCIPFMSHYFPNQSPSLHFSYSGKLKNEHVITTHIYFLHINKLMYF